MGESKDDPRRRPDLQAEGDTDEHGTTPSHVQERLEIERERLDLALQAGGMGLWDRDLLADTIVWNDTLYRLLGCDPAEPITSETFFEYIHADDRARVEAKAETWFAGGSPGSEFHDEFRIVRSDGKVRWLVAVGRLYCDGQGTPIRAVGVNYDITDRVHARQQIANLAKFPEENPYPVLRADADGLLRYANQAARRLLTDAAGKDADRLPSAWSEAAAEAIRAGQGQDLEFRTGGRVFLFTVVPVPEFGCTNWYGYDVTGRAKVQQAVRESEAGYRRLLHTSQEGVWMTDTEGVTTYVNPQMASMLGYEPEEMVGRSAFDFAWPEDLSAAREEWQRRQADSAGRSCESRYRHRDGHAVSCLVNSSKILDGDGHATGVLGMFTDITPLRRIEAALQESHEKLEQRVDERTLDLQQTVSQLQDEVTRRQLAETTVRERSDELVQLNKELEDFVGKLQREVRARVKAEEQVRASHNRLFAVLNLFPGYVVLKDRQYQIRFASHGFLDQFGDSGGRPCHEMQYGLAEPCEDCPMAEVLDEGQTVDWEQSYADGTTYHVWAYPFQNVDGTEMLLEFGLNITDRKRLELLISEMSEAERRRIGRDLHDALGQTMTGLGYLIGGLADRVAKAMPQEKATAEQAIETIREATAQVRALAHGLDPVGLESEGLGAALGELARNSETVCGIPCGFTCDPLDPLDEFCTTHLYRIAQEALNNAGKHSQATRIEMALEGDGETTILRIADDGVGLPPNRSAAAGMGLRVMRYRAGAIGARLRINSGPEYGTVVTCVLPGRPTAQREGAAP